jgi:Protein of unknown function DUF86
VGVPLRVLAPARTSSRRSFLAVSEGCWEGVSPAPSRSGLSIRAVARIRVARIQGSPPWREVYGFRNIPAHAYLDIDLERVWEIVTDHLPPLRTAVEKELPRPSA